MACGTFLRLSGRAEQDRAQRLIVGPWAHWLPTSQVVLKN